MSLSNDELTHFYKNLRSWIWFWASGDDERLYYAEDLLQFAMEKIFEHRDNIKPVAMLKYAQTVVIHHWLNIIDRYEYKHTESSIYKDGDDENVDNKEVDFKEENVLRYTGEQIMNAINSPGILTTTEREVMEMVLEEYTEEEISKRLNVSRSTVARSLRSARSKLHNHYSQ
jgi:RNA polymerase sigma factor (sigma-70 family)